MIDTERQNKSEATAVFTVKLTAQEIQLLATLASDQLFRREFIDPKMPGHKVNPAETTMGKALVNRLRTILDPSLARRAATARKG